jgi:hypothetical protein
LPLIAKFKDFELIDISVVLAVQFGLNGRGKSFQRTLFEALSVDENCGGASDTDPAPLPEIAVDKGGDLRVAALFSEPIHIQTQILCKLFEKFMAQLVVIFKNLVVVLPEFPLLAGGKGSLGSRLSQLVVPEREVLEH